MTWFGLKISWPNAPTSTSRITVGESALRVVKGRGTSKPETTAGALVNPAPEMGVALWIRVVCKLLSAARFVGPEKDVKVPELFMFATSVGRTVPATSNVLPGIIEMFVLISIPTETPPSTIAVDLLACQLAFFL